MTESKYIEAARKALNQPNTIRIQTGRGDLGQAVAEAIESAADTERERCATIAEEARIIGDAHNYCATIARRIREGE